MVDNEEFITALTRIPGNTMCCDCSSQEYLTWASSNVGVVVCNECVGGHRALGEHISEARSLKMDMWTPEMQQVMLSHGNNLMNAQLEAHPVTRDFKPQPDSPLEHKQAYVRSKYANGAFCATGSGQMEQWQCSPAKQANVSAGQVNAGICVVKVVKATNLVKADMFGKSDPYVVVEHGSTSVKTKVIKKTLNPEWNETLTLNIGISDLDKPIQFQVWDWDKVSKDDKIGNCSISFHEFPPSQPTDVALPLQNVKKGTLFVQITWCPLDA